MSVEAATEIDTPEEASTDRGDNLPVSDTRQADVPAEDGKADTSDTERDEKGRFVKKEAEDPEAAQDAASGETKPDPQDEDLDEKVDRNSPAYRIRKLVEDRNKLRAEIEALKAAPKAPETATNAKDSAKEFAAKLDELYEKVEEARADGDTKSAAQLQRQIDRMNQDLTRYEAQQSAVQATERASMNHTYNEMAEYLAQVEPRTNRNAPEFDPALIQQLEFNVRAYENAGMTAVQALQYATSLVFGRDPFAEGRKPTAATAAPPPPKKTDIAKNVDAAKRIPPAVESRATADDARLDPTTMSDEEFDKLPASVKRKLRGDAA